MTPFWRAWAFPGQRENAWQASTKAKVRSMCMQWLSLVVRECTTAWLSHRHTTRVCTQSGPQTAKVRTTGSSSLIIICNPAERSSQRSWNQCLPCQAPQPHPPEALGAFVFVLQLPVKKRLLAQHDPFIHVGCLAMSTKLSCAS